MTRLTEPVPTPEAALSFNSPVRAALPGVTIAELATHPVRPVAYLRRLFASG